MLTTAMSLPLFACALLAAAACGSNRPPEPPSTARTLDDDCTEPADSEHPMQMTNDHRNHHGVYEGAHQWAQRFDDPARDAWQRPDDVIRALDLRPTMTVADVGAGTGYFAVRLARAVPDGVVIATDLAPDMVRYLEERARREQLPNLRAVQATATTSGLPAGSVDAILIVHVWHHIAARSCYARDIAAALKPGGSVVIVDFSPEAPKGPPMHMRLAPEKVVDDLRAAGLRAQVSAIELPDQYIVEAHRDR